MVTFEPICDPDSVFVKVFSPGVVSVYCTNCNKLINKQFETPASGLRSGIAITVDHFDPPVLIQADAMSIRIVPDEARSSVRSLPEAVYTAENLTISKDC